MRTTSRLGCALPIVLFACGAGQVSPDAPASGAPRADRNLPPDTTDGPRNAEVAAADSGAPLGARSAVSRESLPTHAGDAGSAGGPHVHDPGRSAEDIRAIVVAHRDAARACYESSLANHPGIEGNLVLRWTIDPKGNVTEVSGDPAGSQILEPTLVACVGDVIKKIRFAPSPRGFETKAFYPFNFHPAPSARSAP